MDDPAAASSGDGSWPDPPGAGEPPAPGVVPPGLAYGCTSQVVGTKATYSIATGAGITGNADIFSDVVTPYGDGIRVGSATTPEVSRIYKSIPLGAATYISYKFKANTSPADDNGAMYLDGPAGQRIGIIPGREAFYDALKRPLLFARRNTGDGFTTVYPGAAAVTLGQWYTITFQISAGVLSYDIRTADTDVVHSTGTLPGVWSALDLNVMTIDQDANTTTGSSDFAALRLCGTASVAIPGTEKLTGLSMTVVDGDVNSPGGSVALTGKAMTASTGNIALFSASKTAALVGQSMSTFNVARMTPAEYPFLRSGTVTTSVPYLGTPVVFVLRFNSDGSVTQQINGGAITPFFVDTWAYPADGRPNATTTMIPVTAVPNAFKQTFSINKVTAAYTATLAANSSMAAGCTFTFTARASGASYYDYVAIVPTAINPKYGQFGYTSLFYLTFNT